MQQTPKKPKIEIPKVAKLVKSSYVICLVFQELQNNHYLYSGHLKLYFHFCLLHIIIICLYAVDNNEEKYIVYNLI